jgi:cytochrome c-type biogenesis protein CcmH
MTTTVQRRTARPGAASAMVVVAVLVAVAALVFVGLRGAPTVSRAQQAHQIAAGLRCPVCQDLSAADSPAPLAGQMRHQIRQQLADGASADQIRARFVASYGDSVLMTPPHRGAGWIAGVLPLGVLLIAIGTAGILLHRWRTAPTSAAPATPEAEDLPSLSVAQRRQLDRALAQLRAEEPR